MTGFEGLIFLTTDDIGSLPAIIDTLGGKDRGARASVMQTPNNPAGRSRQIEAFWNRYFPMRPGHWSGWEFETYPRITEIDFLDDARTRAGVKVTVGYSGATVLLIKTSGVWRAQELVDFWIT